MHLLIMWGTDLGLAWLGHSHSARTADTFTAHKFVVVVVTATLKVDIWIKFTGDPIRTKMRFMAFQQLLCTIYKYSDRLSDVTLY